MHMEGSVNLTALLVKWWYGDAIANILKYIKAAYVYFADLFSVRICIQTIFDPWKRDMLSYEGQSLQQKFHTWTMNLASRIIGALVKLATLFGYLIFIGLMSLFSGIILILWLIYPALIVFFLYRIFA